MVNFTRLQCKLIKVLMLLDHTCFCVTICTLRACNCGFLSLSLSPSPFHSTSLLSPLTNRLFRLLDTHQDEWRGTFQAWYSLQLVPCTHGCTNNIWRLHSYDWTSHLFHSLLLFNFPKNRRDKGILNKKERKREREGEKTNQININARQMIIWFASNYLLFTVHLAALGGAANGPIRSDARATWTHFPPLTLDNLNASCHSYL